MTETIIWRIFEDPPSHGRVILIQLTNGKVDAGWYRDGEFYFVGDSISCDVAWWAEWPKGATDADR